MQRKSIHIVAYVLIILLMTNLTPLVGLFLHPEIPYFDPEYLIVGSIIGLFSAVLFGALLYYTNKVSASIAELNKLNTILREQSVRDGLTGLYNHRHFHEMLRHEFLLAKRHKADLACLMLDLDHFKEINDTCGHPFGDIVLSGTANQILCETRITDTVARYGGEEFGVLLPNTDLKGALAIAERIRLRTGDYIHKQDSHARKVTISIGLATIMANQPGTPEDLLRLADQALYRAKETGRNKVVPFNSANMAEQEKKEA